MPAIDLVVREDTKGTLFYCDPPYLHETRTSTDAYAFEMSEEEHRQLLATLIDCKGKVMISGYSSSLYDSILVSWNRHTFELPNNAASGKVKRRMTEVLWCNF
jgi:DNA adenine methylase